MAAKFTLPAAALVLASTSRTRQKMLQNAGLNFTAVAPNVDEIALRGSAKASAMPPLEIAVFLADMKARKVAQNNAISLNSQTRTTYVLGSDQLLVCDDEILAKPQTLEAAAGQLALLSGRTHHLHTVAVIYRDGERIWHHIESPAVTLRQLDEAFIKRYLTTLGEAAFFTPGSYQMEGLGAHLFAGIKGCSYSVLGLPLLQILAFLRTHGLGLESEE